jgi:ubiquinone/menaquinone biosynthesis C-methylase UbiE
MRHIIKSVASYHHFPDIHATSRILARFLKPGGSLLVADILKEAGPASGSQLELLDKYKDIVVHKSGFTEAEIRENMKQAGLYEIDFRIIAEASFHGKDVRFFVAKGLKTLENE